MILYVSRFQEPCVLITGHERITTSFAREASDVVCQKASIIEKLLEICAVLVQMALQGRIQRKTCQLQQRAAPVTWRL